jgi:predicted ABC-type exoprotein transport system permease subunit
MKYFSPMLAQEEMSVDKAFGAWSSMNEEARTRLIMFAAYALVIGVVLLWALFIRKQKAKRRRIYKKQHAWEQSEGVEKRRQRRRRRQRSAPSPQNPSRAETGGLPPRRPEDVPPAGD